jgi:hypothetical protein
MKFRDVLSLWEAGELSMMAAGELLGIPGVRLGAVDCVDRTEIVTPSFPSSTPTAFIAHRAPVL